MTTTTPAASSPSGRVATWEPPGPGSWIADRSHGDGNHTPWFRRIAGTLTEPTYAAVLAKLGAALGSLDLQFVNGTMYRRAVPLVGARFDKGTPPPTAAAWLVCRLHPKFRAREKTAVQTIEAKPFRRVIANWHAYEKGEWERRNREFQAVEPRDLDDADMAAHLRALDAHCGEGWQRHHTLHAYDLGPIGDLLQHAIDWGIAPVAAMSLLRGSSPATTEAAAHGRTIADALRDGGVDPGDVRDLDTVRSVPAAGAALDAYLDVFGWRLISSYDLDGRALYELPAAICAIIRAGAEGTEPLGVDSEAEAAVRSMASDTALFDELLADARAAYGLRDDNGPLTWEWPAGLMRRAYLAAGERLHEREQLLDADHIINLDVEELASMLDGGVGPDAAAIAARHDHREWEGSLLGPDHLGAPPDLDPDLSPLTPGIRRLMGIVMVALALLEPDTEVERERLVGTGIGEGTYRGIARVAHDAAVAVESMEPGDVLVAPWTAPSYNAVLSIAGGIVVQEGGVLCHAAVMARELAVPAVVGCTDAMAEINSGDLVEIDPASGRVTVIERAATV